MALTQEQLDAVKNKYLDGEGLAHLWEKIKAQSAKIALIGSTGSTWEEILLQESNEEDKKYIKWLLSAEQDVMIEDVSDNNRRYYYVRQEKGDHERLDYIWESYSSSKIYRITVKGDNLALILTKEEFPYKDQDGYAINTYVAGAYIDDNKNKIHFIDGTYNHSTNNLEVEVNNTGGTLIFNDKVGNKTLTFDVASYVADEVSDATQNLIEIAEGKTKAYVIGKFTSATGQGKAVLNDQFQTNDENLTLTIRTTTIEGSNTWAGFEDPNGNFISLEGLKVGDVVLLKGSDYPDRWVSNIDESKQAYAEATFTSLEADKIDLNGYVTGTGLTSNNIILGNGDSKIQASTYSIGGSVKNDNTAGKTVPTNKAIIDYAQPKLPTGTSGQILKSSGSGAPTWVNQSTLSVGSATKATQDGNGNNIASTYVPKTSSSNEAQAIITNENGEVSITSAESGVSVVPEGAALFSATQDGMNVLSVNEDGAFFNDGNKDYRIVDYSMTLTTGEIDKIIKDLENNS